MDGVIVIDRSVTWSHAGAGLGRVSGPLVNHRPTAGIITPAGRCAGAMWTLLLATAWSLGTGKRQWRRQQEACSPISRLTARPRIRKRGICCLPTRWSAVPIELCVSANGEGATREEAVDDLREALAGLIAEFGVPDELTVTMDVV